MVTIEQQFKRLNERIDVGRPDLDLWEQYTRGTVPLEFVAPEVRKATEDRLKTLQMPFARHVIAAIEERLTVVGFRTADADQADARLWSVWQQNNLDEGSQMLHSDALQNGRAFALVWADSNGNPTITVESARECAVLFAGATRSRVAGLKRWISEEKGHAVLFLPDRVVKFVTKSAVVGDGQDTPGSLEGATWIQTDTLPNPLGVVPLVPFVNRPSITEPSGRSELADLTSIFDAVFKLSTDLMVTAESHASPRRWASGLQLEEETDDETGHPTGDIDKGTRFSDLAGRLWVAEDPSARFGEFPGSDLVGFLNSLNMLKRDLSSLASLPAHYLGIQGDQPSSADAIRAAEASLVALVRRKAATFSGGWEEVLRLADAVSRGYFDPTMMRLETLWADFETRTDAQSVDAASKAVGAGILSPDFAAERYLDLSPTETQRNREARRAQALEDAAAALVNSTAPKVIEQ